MCVVVDTFKKMKCAELAEALRKIIDDESYKSDLQKLRGNTYTSVLGSIAKIISLLATNFKFMGLAKAGILYTVLLQKRAYGSAPNIGLRLCGRPMFVM